MRKVIPAFVLLALIACTNPGAFFVTVVFPDAASKEQTRRVRVVALEAGQGCQSLVDGAVRPGDEGYAIEDEVTVAYPSGDGARALETEGAGTRLFFAEALDESDQPILHGCSEAEGGGSGHREVIVELAWIGEPCQIDTECDDDVFCNGEELCVDGRCEREARDCDDADPCTDDTCNEGLDRCDHTPVAEPPGHEGPQGDPTCDDGLDNDCDGLTDAADTGCISCTDNTECDDLNACTTDSCEEGACLNAAVTNGQACDDELFCTDQDVCTGGICRGSERNCSAVEDGCNTAGCDELGNACVPIPVPDGTGCDDDQWCTEADTCVAGTCVGAARDCGSQAGGCIVGVCDEAQDLCEDQPAADGTACDDGLYCTVDDRCSGGTCTSGGDRDCSASGGGCIDGVCDEDAGACVGDPLPAGTACDDEVNCTEDDTCDGDGACGGQPMDCSAFDNQCNLGVCNEGSGTCVRQSANEDQPCDDGLFCSEGESCLLGLCEGGGPTDCEDGDACTADLCDEASDQCNHPLTPIPGAEGLAVAGTCDDSTDNDCDGLTDLADVDCQECQTDVDCTDGNPCTTNQCTMSQCQTTPAPDGTPCADGDFCTEPDICTTGVCGGSPRDCSALDDQCNLGVCNEAQDQCQPQPYNEGGACDDGFFCTTAEICQSGACGGGSLTDCSHLDDPCNLGACDEGTGACEAQIANQGGPCDDGIFCTSFETCLNGACLAGGPTDCSHLDEPCRSGVCNPGSDMCEAVPDTAGSPCEDGLGCTSSDQCDGAGTCLPGPWDDSYCDAMNPGDVCRPDCFQTMDGCGTPPSNLLVACSPNPVDLGSADTTDCLLSLGMSNHQPCLSCSHRQPIRTLDVVEGDNCDLGGWTLLGDDSCADDISGCSETGTITCCDNLGGICEYWGPSDDWYLRCDRATNGCGNMDDEWRLVKSFDLRGLTEGEVCYEVADSNADNNDGLLVFACDAATGCVQLSCHIGRVVQGTEWLTLRFCALMPAWANDNPDVEIRFVAHSNNTGDVILLDGISVRAWSDGCVPSYVQAFTEDFDTCPDNPPNGWNGWTVIGDLECDEREWNCLDGNRQIFLRDNPARIERYVDASGLDEDVTLCLEFSDNNANNSELRVEVDAGSGWQRAWSHEGDFGNDRDCKQQCVSLSNVDPAVNNNPSLGIAIDIDPDNAEMYVDAITLNGAVHCPGGGELQLGPLSDNGNGTYSFTAQDVAGTPMYPDIMCTWGNPAQGTTGLDPVLFQ